MKFLRLVLAAGLSFASFANNVTAADIHEMCRRLGRGVNLGNMLEAPPNSGWAIPVDHAWLPRIRAAGFDSIRLPVRWSSYARDNPSAKLRPEIFSKVDGILDAAEKAGLNVVLNVHHFDELDKDPATHGPRLVALWEQLGEHYRNRGGGLYFELNNEPHDKLTAALWNELIPKALAAVRASHPSRPVIIGPANWNNLSALPTLKLPADPNLIVTFHYYSPFEFTHQGATWTTPKVRDIRDRAWTGDTNELAAVRKDFAKVADWARQTGRPIYLGEFGAYQNAPMESRVRWTAAIRAEAEARGFAWAYWEFGAGFGVFNRQADAWRDGLLKALIYRR
jgi:endoglucanase